MATFKEFIQSIRQRVNWQVLGGLAIFLLVFIFILSGIFYFSAKREQGLREALKDEELVFDSSALMELFVKEAKASFLPLDAEIKIEFPYPAADLQNIRDNLTIEPLVAGGLVDFDGKNIIFRHDKNFDPATKYKISIPSGVITGEDSVLEEEIVYEFSTRPDEQLGYHYWGSPLIYSINYYWFLLRR